MTLKSISLACLSLTIGFYACSLGFFMFKKKRTAEFFFISGFLSHTISQVSRGWLIGIFTPIALFEEVFFLPWCLAFLTLCLRFFKKDFQLIYSAVIPILFFLLIALLYPKGVFPPSPQVQTVFSPLFFLFEVLAHTFFCIGAWFSICYLYHRNDASFFYSFVIWGFILYSIAQVVGAIWCYLGWASLFNWSERHLQSAAIWCFYAAFLHLRFLYGLDMKKKAGFAITGYAFVFLLSYIGHLGEMNAVRLGR
jgi:ABC-type transport system involved in cytochrome c biogenesis permease subunit